MTENNAATIGFEEQIWDVANVPRGNTDEAGHYQY